MDPKLQTICEQVVSNWLANPGTEKLERYLHSVLDMSMEENVVKAAKYSVANLVNEHCKASINRLAPDIDSSIGAELAAWNAGKIKIKIQECAEALVADVVEKRMSQAVASSLRSVSSMAAIKSAIQSTIRKFISSGQVYLPPLTKVVKGAILQEVHGISEAEITVKNAGLAILARAWRLSKQGRSSEEIATLIGVAPSKVDAILLRARDRLDCVREDLALFDEPEHPIEGSAK